MLIKQDEIIKFYPGLSSKNDALQQIKDTAHNWLEFAMQVFVFICFYFDYNDKGIGCISILLCNIAKNNGGVRTLDSVHP